MVVGSAEEGHGGNDRVLAAASLAFRSFRGSTVDDGALFNNQNRITVPLRRQKSGQLEKFNDPGGVGFLYLCRLFALLRKQEGKTADAQWCNEVLGRWVALRIGVPTASKAHV